jgi:hypothetical protein
MVIYNSAACLSIRKGEYGCRSGEVENSWSEEDKKV